jgi:DNA-binding PadR family transcriptional regulator
MSKQTKRNKNAVLRALYVSDTASIKDIADSTYLSREQTQRAIRSLLDGDKVEVYTTEQVRGALPDRKIYTLTDRGFQEIRNRELEQSQEVQNSKEIEKLNEEILSLNNKIRRYKNELEEWKRYTSKHNKATEGRIKQLEKEVFED